MSYCSEELSFCLLKWKAAALATLTSRYVLACAVYVAYSVGMVLASAPGVDSDTKNKLYFQFGVVHLVNSFMYIWTWEGKSLFDKIMIPEYLNVLGAVLYLWSSTFYGHEYVTDSNTGGFSSTFYMERQLEFWASVIEVFAAFGWIFSWHSEYTKLSARVPGPIPSRGWTFDDPDLSANITIAVAAVIYFIYNCQIVNDYSAYETNMLYKLGDQLYLINSLFYLCAAFRDCHWFWFLPKFGKYMTIREIMLENQQAEIHLVSYAKVEHDTEGLLSEAAKT